MTLWQEVARDIGAATGEAFIVRAQRRVGGGCIHNALVLEDDRRQFFVKHNSVSRRAMFEAEAEGLQALESNNSLRVPHVIAVGHSADDAYIVLEYLDLGHSSERPDLLGIGLATLHRQTGDQYGWAHDNFIGSTPQHNAFNRDWAAFWRDTRLAAQYHLAETNGYRGRLMSQGEKLLADLPVFFRDYRPQASLVHGDLWSGNYAYDTSGRPVIFDPAVYYGDRETDIAMTELFGGFPASFYAAYRDAWPLDAGYRVRRGLYNLYHVLNHLNLFGGGYGAQAERMTATLLSEIA